MRAKKNLGQNFLRDESVISRIVGELAPRGDETIIEIGSGYGALTSQLVERAGRLVAIELDRGLVPVLREKFANRDNFEVIEQDALASDFCSLIAPAQTARVIANLPYNISTAILQRLIEQRRCLTEMLLMLQREVVERIMAPPSTSARGFLSVLVEAHCEAAALFDVAPGAFRPVPKVWSTIVRLRVRPTPAAEVEDEKLLWRLVSIGFMQRRKTLFNNLRHAPEDLRAKIELGGGAARVLTRAGVNAERRAETLTLAEWVSIAGSIAA
ncbi:MAG: 16S rRNA (adenine(1518)-N(6)/adenine(1519)-N(6))-dimethyltransferase RsmA [Acidobacteriota bacterium]|nr:16S rRNA (adenine(1518)-N(6)/adenine(1519)-N(6))-dimethyltransferase RsmA [Acidobacteriota bacterium]